MTTQTTTQECECNLPREMSWAGPAAQLCPHSALDPALEIQANLAKLLDDFMQEIPVEDLLNKPLLELGEKYMKDVLGNDFNLMNQREHNVLMIAFLRHVGIAVMTLLASMVVNRNRNQANEQAKKPAKKQSTDILRNKPDPIFDEIDQAGKIQETTSQSEDEEPTLEQPEDQETTPLEDLSQKEPAGEDSSTEATPVEATPVEATPDETPTEDEEVDNPLPEKTGPR